MKNKKHEFHSEEPQLASDLDWLLQSHQFSSEKIVAVLVEAFYPQLYRWTSLCLADPQAAAAAALQTILQAGSQAYHYQGAPGVQAWIFSLAAGEIRRSWRRQGWKRLAAVLPFRFPGEPAAAVQPAANKLDAALWHEIDRLPPVHRLALNLAANLGWEADQIGQVLDIPAEQVSGLLELSYGRAQARINQLDPQVKLEPESPLTAVLSASLARRQLDLAGEQFDLAELAELAVAEFTREAQRANRSLRWKETLWLGGTAGLVLALLWALTVWLPEPDSALDTPGSNGTPEVSLIDRLATQTPAATLPAGSIALYYVQPGDTLLEIASFLGVPVDELRHLNPHQLNDALRPGQTLRVLLRPPDGRAIPTEVVPTVQLEPFNPPNAFPENFLQWLVYASNRWTSIWLEAVWLDYGPLGVVQAPESTRFQAWFTKPDHDLTLWQNPADLSYTRTLNVGEWQYHSSSEQEIEIRFAGDHLPGSAVDSSRAPLNARSLVYPSRMEFFRQPGEWRLLEHEQIAGRSVVLAEWRKHTSSQAVAAAQDLPQVTRRQLWIDASTGVVLRWQEFFGQHGEILLRELIVASIQYDQEFLQADLFAPWTLNDRAFLDQDSGWLSAPHDLQALLRQTPPGRARLAKIPPSTRFNPAAARLKIQYPAGRPPDSQPTDVDLFAGSYYLGQIPISDPARMLCERSADGEQIAYTYDPFGNPDIMRIGWFQLSYPLQPNRIEIPLIPDSLAFSPDGRYLAYYASPLYASLGSLTLLDTQTSEQRRLAGLVYASSLVWSPDGRSLAMIVADPEPEMREARILDVTTRSFTYRQKITIESLLNAELRGPDWPAEDWPAHQWGVEFPIERQGWQDCL